MKTFLFIFLVIIFSVITTGIGSAQYSLIEAASASDRYGCYDYVRAALEANPSQVNLMTGVPIPGILPYPGHPTFDLGNDTPIYSDPKYVFISDINNCDVVVFPVVAGHAALKLTYSGFASKWNTDGGLYYQTLPTTYNFSEIQEPPQYMVYIGNIYPASTTLNPGQQVQFSVNYKAGVTYSWSYSSTYFDLVSGGNSNSITLQAKCSGGGGNQTVSVSVTGLNTRTYEATATLTTLNCPCYGIYQVASGPAYQLNTYNSVTNSPIVVTLNGGSGISYSWTFTGGNPSSWYYYGTGNKSLYIALNRGASASFRFVSGSCNRNIAFSRSSYRMAVSPDSGLASTAAPDTLFLPYKNENESAGNTDTGIDGKTSVYMNQSMNTLIVNNNIEGKSNYKITSIQGIIKKTGVIFSGQTEIELHDLQSGIYIISIDKNRSYRFVKQ